MEHNVSKLCMILMSHEHYKCTLHSVTFDLYQGYRVRSKFKWTTSISQELVDLNEMIFGMQVTSTKRTSPTSVLFVNFAFKGRKLPKYEID